MFGVSLPLRVAYRQFSSFLGKIVEIVKKKFLIEPKMGTGVHGTTSIGVARGALGARAPPGRRNFWAKLTEESCKCTHAPGRECIIPLRQSKSPIFGGNWGDLDGERACELRTTTKKVANLLGEERCTPDKILATPMTTSYEPLTTFYDERCDLPIIWAGEQERQKVKNRFKKRHRRVTISPIYMDTPR